MFVDIIRASIYDRDNFFQFTGELSCVLQRSSSIYAPPFAYDSSHKRLNGASKLGLITDAGYKRVFH